MWAMLSTEGVLTFEEGIPDLAQMQAGVGGPLLAVDMPGIGTMWLNEEGKLAGLAANPKAGHIAQLTRAGLAQHAWIAGNVLFTGRPNDGGEPMGLSDEAVARLREHYANAEVQP